MFQHFPPSPWTCRALHALFTLAVLFCSTSTSAGTIPFEAEIWCQDGTVDQQDLDRVIRNYGDCPDGEECLEDLNGNDFVGRMDLAAVLGHWGDCHCEGDFNQDGVRDHIDEQRLDNRIAAAPNCLTDLDRSGKVDGIDLYIQMESWEFGPDGHPGIDVNGDGGLSATDVLLTFQAIGLDCHGDFNHDGAIDEDDRTIFLGCDSACNTLKCPAPPEDDNNP